MESREIIRLKELRDAQIIGSTEYQCYHKAFIEVNQILITKRRRVSAKRIPIRKRPISNYESLPQNVQDIINIIMINTGISHIEILSNARQGEVVRARHLSMYLCFKYVNESPSVVGAWFNRDHSTCYNARTCVMNYSDTNVKYKKTLDDLENICFDRFIKNNLLSNQVVASF